MQSLIPRLLAAKGKLILGVTAFLAFTHAQAGIPVIDAANVTQNVVQAMQAVAAVEKQIQQYQTQLQQYENALQNTVAPAAYVWDQANVVINKLVAAQDTLSYYKNQAGSIDNYLARYKNVNSYRTSPCFSAAGCSDSERKALSDATEQGSDAVKRANDSVLRGIDQQQTLLSTDALRLTDLQRQATSAKGQMEAIQAANQFASAQNNQLLQIRTLLVAAQNSEATRQQVAADRAAQEAAASQQLRTGSFQRSSPKSW